MKEKDNKKQIKYDVLFSSIILIVIIILLLFILLNRKPKLEENTIITIDGEVVETYEVEITNFYPGYEKEYKILFLGEIDKYNISVFFTNPNEGRLKEYLNIIIETKNTYLKNTMNYYLNSEEIYLGKGINEIIIKYEMPEDVGNEAQGTDVKFYLNINITN